MFLARGQWGSLPSRRSADTIVTFRHSGGRHKPKPRMVFARVEGTLELIVEVTQDKRMIVQPWEKCQAKKGATYV